MSEVKIENKEEAIKALESLHILVYSRLKGKGLSLIEKIIDKDAELLASNKELFISYITSASNDISKTIKRALEFLNG
jgi:hypothetical protein